MFKSRLYIDSLIQENDTKYINGLITNFEYNLINNIYQEASYLTEDEEGGVLNHLKRNWGKYAGAGVGIGMAHAGAFGDKAQNFVNNVGTMGQNMGERMASHASDAMKQTSDFYKTPGMVHGSDYHPNNNIGNLSGSYNGNHMSDRFNNPHYNGMNSGEIKDLHYVLRDQERNHLEQHINQNGGVGTNIGNSIDNTVNDAADFANDNLGWLGLGAAGLGTLVGAKYLNNKKQNKVNPVNPVNP